MHILYNMTMCIVYPIEFITGEWGAIQILPVPCSPLIEVALYNDSFSTRTTLSVFNKCSVNVMHGV